MVPTLLLVMLVAGAVAVLVWLPRIDGAAREMVTVQQSDFASGDLPQICAKTGVSADVGVQIGREPMPMLPSLALREPIGLLPLSAGHHARFLTWKQLNRQVWVVFVVAFFGSLIVGLVGGDTPSTWMSGFGDALVLVAAAGFLMAIVTKLGARRLVADPRLAETEGAVELRGIHPDFARAVIAARGARA